MGTAAGAAIGKGAFTIFREPVDFVMRPPGLMDARGIYALFVENDSMSPRYEPGELIYVNEFRPVTPGDYVVIQEPATNGEDYNAFVKLLVRRTAEWIETRQLNPPREVKFKNSKGLRIHKVMTNADMFGV
jgi:phage repressor protein C with HTH and peptisase S24 domain